MPGCNSWAGLETGVRHLATWRDGMTLHPSYLLLFPLSPHALTYLCPLPSLGDMVCRALYAMCHHAHLCAFLPAFSLCWHELSLSFSSIPSL